MLWISCSWLLLNCWVSSICRSDASPSQEMLPLPCQVATCQKLIQPKEEPDYHTQPFCCAPSSPPKRSGNWSPALRLPDVVSIFHESTALSDGGLHGALPFGASAAGWGAFFYVAPTGEFKNQKGEFFVEIIKPFTNRRMLGAFYIFNARVSEKLTTQPLLFTRSFLFVFFIQHPSSQIGWRWEGFAGIHPCESQSQSPGHAFQRYVFQWWMERLAGGWLSQSRRILVALLVTTPFQKDFLRS